MPEGHTVHRLARDLGELRGQRLAVSSPQGRFATAAGRIDGAVLDGIEPFGKHLFLRMNTGDVLHVHLGMQGKWFRYADPTGIPLRQVRVRLASTRVAWDLIAPSGCELLDETGMERVTSGLGPDPLRADCDAVSAIEAIGAEPRPIGAVLLDQAVIAGVGNVFRSEALHALGVNPSRPGRSMSKDQVTELWAVLQKMMAQGVEDGRIITVESPDRLLLPESEARRVYKQEHCRDCGAPVTVATVGSRTAYYCPVEQAD